MCLFEYFYTFFQAPVTEETEESQKPNIAVSTAIANNKQGQYYILQSNGLLQKVTYKTSQNPTNKNSPIVSNLKYEPVPPIRDPIYSYNNGRFVRIN